MVSSPKACTGILFFTLVFGSGSSRCVDAARMKRGRLVKRRGADHLTTGATPEKEKQALANKEVASSVESADQTFGHKIEERRSDEHRWSKTFDSVAQWKKNKRHRESGAHHNAVSDSSHTQEDHLHDRRFRNPHWTSMLDKATRWKGATNTDEARPEGESLQKPCPLVECPAPGKVSVIDEDEHGCPIQKCEPLEAVASDQQIVSPSNNPDFRVGEQRGWECMSKICEAHEKAVVLGTDANGCPIEKCEPMEAVKLDCPELACGVGEKVATGTDDNGCPIEHCVEKKITFHCPPINCGAGGKTKRSGTDAHGCALEECDVDCSHGCLQMMCEEGQTTSCHGNDECGCSVCECVPRILPRVVSPKQKWKCVQRTCDEGSIVIVTGIDTHGCQIQECS